MSHTGCVIKLGMDIHLQSYPFALNEQTNRKCVLYEPTQMTDTAANTNTA